MQASSQRAPGTGLGARQSTAELLPSVYVDLRSLAAAQLEQEPPRQMPGKVRPVVRRGKRPRISPGPQIVAQQPNFQCDIRASFATAFRNWRRKNNVPLKKVAGDLRLAVATVNSWELGKRFPSGRNFERLANYTGVPPCRLFCVMADKCVPAECLLAMGRKP